MDKTMSGRGAPVLVLAGLVVLVSACAEAPTAVVAAARARVDAVDTDGQIYAPEEYAVARDAVGRLDAELQVQADRFAVTRSYDRAAELATEVERAVDDVERAIDSEKDRLRAEAARLVADAEGAIDSVRSDIDQLPEEESADLRAEVAQVESSLAAIEANLQSGRYLDAHETAQSAVAAARDIGTALARLAEASETVDDDAVMRAVRGGFDLPRRAYADGQSLEPGPYRVRLTDESAPVVDDEPQATTRWVEFLHEEDGSVAGRDLATVIPDSEIDEVTEGWRPRNQVRTDELLGGDYVRVWLNRAGSNYLVHMPTSAP